MFEQKLDILSISEYNDPISNRGSGNFKTNFGSNSSSNRNVLVDKSSEREIAGNKEDDKKAEKSIRDLRSLKNCLTSENNLHKSVNLQRDRREAEMDSHELRGEKHHQVKFNLHDKDPGITDDNREEPEVLNKTVNEGQSKTRNDMVNMVPGTIRLNQTVAGPCSKKKIKLKNVIMPLSRIELKCQRVVPVSVDLSSSGTQAKGESGDPVIKVKTDQESKFSLLFKNVGNFDWPTGIKLELFLVDKMAKKKSKSSKSRIILTKRKLQETLSEGEVCKFDFDFDEVLQNVAKTGLNVDQFIGDGFFKAKFYSTIGRKKYFSTHFEIKFEIEN